jgi:hypothetical protein
VGAFCVDLNKVFKDRTSLGGKHLPSVVVVGDVRPGSERLGFGQEFADPLAVVTLLGESLRTELLDFSTGEIEPAF